ncbi:4Fe-4S dicluster domain-containing protein, partial [Parvibacter caecicola]
RYLNEEERVVEKCTLCEQRVAQGELPQCVAQCGGMARFFGDMEKGLASFEGPELGASRVKLSDFAEPFTDADVHALPNAGNDPSFRYILRKFAWQG